MWPVCRGVVVLWVVLWRCRECGRRLHSVAMLVVLTRQENDDGQNDAMLAATCAPEADIDRPASAQSRNFPVASELTASGICSCEAHEQQKGFQDADVANLLFTTPILNRPLSRILLTPLSSSSSTSSWLNSNN